MSIELRLRVILAHSLLLYGADFYATAGGCDSPATYGGKQRTIAFLSTDWREAPSSKNPQCVLRIWVSWICLPVGGAVSRIPMPGTEPVARTRIGHELREMGFMVCPRTPSL
jgi:hypothetical protein